LNCQGYNYIDNSTYQKEHVSMKMKYDIAIPAAILLAIAGLLLELSLGIALSTATGGATPLSPSASETPLAPTITETSEPPTYTPVVSCGFTVRSNSYSGYFTAVGELNRDGNADIVTSANGEVPNVLIGRGDGSFTNTNASLFGFTSVIADANGDGIPDVVSAGWNVSVLLSNGDGTFQPVQQYPGPGNSAAMIAGDFNGDNRADLVIAASPNSTNTLYLLLNRGDGSFQLPYAIASMPYISSGISSGDFNSDGNLDLAFGDNQGVTILLGNGDGSFQPASTITLDAGGAVTAIADFNHDGKPDLAVTAGDSSNNSIIWLLLGNGDGTFATPVAYNPGFWPEWMTVADLNLDGNADLVASNYFVYSYTLLLGNGDGTFMPMQQCPLANHVFSINSGDFNGDGRPDLVFKGNESLDVMLNNNDPLFTPTATQTPAAPPTAQPTVCANPFVDISGNLFFHAINALNCQGVISGFDASHYQPSGTASRGQFARIVVLAMGIPITTPGGGQSFTDVPPSSFAYQYVESGYAAGILNGFDPAGCRAVNALYPCYLPANPISRGQLTKLAVNAAHYPLLTPTNGQTFSDVPPSHPFYSYIETAYARHLVNGYHDGTFRPDYTIRRDEMAQIVFTTQQGLIPTPTFAPTNTPPLFTDTATETPTSLPSNTPIPTLTSTPTPGLSSMSHRSGL
jgi:hypothetical protein